MSGAAREVAAILRPNREHLPWRRGGYASEALSNVLSNDDTRVRYLIQAIQRIVLDPGRMRALGFCVSKEHAHFMARTFTRAGLESVALTGDDTPDKRSRRLDELQRGELRCIFSVDVLGEGVDVPDVDCLLLLRPTASATVFASTSKRYPAGSTSPIMASMRRNSA